MDGDGRHPDRAELDVPMVETRLYNDVDVPWQFTELFCGVVGLPVTGT